MKVLRLAVFVVECSFTCGGGKAFVLVCNTVIFGVVVRNTLLFAFMSNKECSTRSCTGACAAYSTNSTCIIQLYNDDTLRCKKTQPLCVFTSLALVAVMVALAAVVVDKLLCM